MPEAAIASSPSKEKPQKTPATFMWLGELPGVWIPFHTDSEQKTTRPLDQTP